MSSQKPASFLQLRTLPTLAVRRNRSICLAGATVGLLTFLFTGLLPSLLVGGSAGAQLARGLMGAQNTPSFGHNAIMVFGVVSAATIGAIFFALLGAVTGAAVGELSRSPAASEIAP